MFCLFSRRFGHRFSCYRCCGRYIMPVLAVLAPVLSPAAVQAQSITSADATTTVQQTGDLYQIEGGHLSGDSATLFHSFNQLGLLTGETAQFSNPATVENIVGRVVGGDASFIDGLLRVNGSANLYLVNPAGVLFGENAGLNLTGAFSASTATGLDFGNDLFDALGTNNYALFQGAPTGYLFNNESASAVINTGDLAVSSGQSLTLLGGHVINTGQLLAPGGEILVMAVPGENRVRLSQTGSLLDLELETVPSGGSQPVPAVTIATVPALLTGASTLGMATDITVNADGTVSLSGSALQIPLDDGTTIVGGQLEAAGAGNIGILGDQIALVGATVEASGDTGGGTVLIGGDQQGQGPVPNALATVIDGNSVVRADARNVGNGGKIIAWGTNLLQSAGQLSARGGVAGGDGGFIETSSLGSLAVGTTPNVAAVNGAGGSWLLDPANIRIVAGGGAVNVATANPFNVGTAATDALLGVDRISEALGIGTNVIISTLGDSPGEGNISLETDLDYNNNDGGSLTLLAQGNIDIAANISDQTPVLTVGVDFPTGDPDDLPVTLQANNQIAISGNISTGAGDLTIESTQGNIAVSGVLTTSSGDISIQASQGAIGITSPILTASGVQTGIPVATVIPAGGDVAIAALNSVVVSDITTSSDMNAGNVSIQSQAATLQAGVIDTSGFVGNAGQVALQALNNIVFRSINASASSGNGAAVTIQTSAGLVRGTDEIAGSTNTIATNSAAQSGNITITHNGGSSQTPFDLGDASVNGTAGSLTTGTTTLANGNPNEPFLGSFTAGNIQIITTEAPPTETPPTETPPTEDPPTVPGCVADCEPVVDPPQDIPDLTDETLPSPDIILKQFEETLTKEVADYLAPGEDLPLYNTADLSTVQNNLLKAQGQTSQRPALIYAVFGMSHGSSLSDSSDSSDASISSNVLQTSLASEPLELLLITAEGDPKYVRLPVTRGEVLRLAHRFRRQVSTPSRVNSTTYLRVAQQLYQILIAPLEAELAAQGITTISFITDAGLRSLPLAALHDGENFLIENYNIGLMPSLSLTDLTYQDLSNVEALIAGTSSFTDQVSLPGVPVELGAISSEWRGKLLQDSAFRIDTLKGERQQNPYGIIHLATHGEFNVGDLSKSYLYFHNERLRLDQLRTIGLNQPVVELLTLSACQTALGNRAAELGFAGFAVLAGAKTSVASLWNVSDQASAGLMIEFYRQLRENQPTIKAEALRQAQLAMLRGDIIIEGDQLKGITTSQKLPLELTIDGQETFIHPYYWAAFNLVGSPW